MPTEVTSITREHVEAFMEHLLETRSPATASNRYRALKRFFGFLVEEGELTSSPMERMKPPMVPEVPPPVLTEDQLKALLKACAGKTFEDKRDTALVRCFIDTGGRRIAGMLSKKGTKKPAMPSTRAATANLDVAHPRRVIRLPGAMDGSGAPSPPRRDWRPSCARWTQTSRACGRSRCRTDLGPAPCSSRSTPDRGS